MEEWNYWKPIQELSGKYYIDFLAISEERLMIQLSNENKVQKVEFIFDGTIDAYRYTNESFCFTIFAELSEKYGDDFYQNWSFFKIINSNYLQWLSKKSGTWANEFSFMHFCILGGDEVIDVLARYEPKVTIMDYEPKEKIIE